MKCGLRNGLLNGLRAWMICSILLGRPAQAGEPTEYQIKAVCLYNFFKFVTWPESTFTNESAPFRLCLAGGNPFGDTLFGLQSKRAQGRPIEVVFLPHPSSEDLNSCHVLFIDTAATLLGTYEHHNGLLTISDHDTSGTIAFRIENNKVRFSIDLEQAQENGLKLSSQLLKLAVSHEEGR